jgi:hypothetical protein
MFVNCWYEGDHESAALWQQVAPHGDSIAIQTTFQELGVAVNETVYAASVSYLDYGPDNSPKGSVLNPFFCKRRLFDYEKEVRLLIDRSDPRSDKPAKGLSVPVDIGSLVRTVVLAPGSGDWVERTLRSVLRGHSIQARIVRSAMDDEPFMLA